MGISSKSGLKKTRLLLLVVGIALSSCHDDSIFNPLRDVEAPVLQLIKPDSSSLLAYIGEEVDFTLEAADDKGLTLFQILYRVEDAGGAQLQTSTQLEQMELSETFESIHYSVVIDTFPPFSQITYSFIVEDQRESRDQVDVVVTVLQSESPSTGIYPTFTYSVRKLWSGASDSLSGYNFSTQQAFPSNWENPLSVDITEISTGDTFSAKLSSPNNERLSRDAIFVHLSPTQINYEEADYEDIWSFYQSADIYTSQSPTLESGDLLIVRLTKAPQPQFALMKILSVQDLPGSAQDYLEFEYKVSSE